jgi:hypothetical protein
MDGPRYYQEAEQLLRAAEQTSRGADQAGAALLLAQAQVHALLALAATTATGTTPHAAQAWIDVTDTLPPVTGSPTEIFFPRINDPGTSEEDEELPPYLKG